LKQLRSLRSHTKTHKEEEWMVGVAGKSGGRRPGAGRRPGSKSIKKDARKGKKKAKVVTVPATNSKKVTAFFMKTHKREMFAPCPWPAHISCRLSAHLHMRFLLPFVDPHSFEFTLS